MAFLSSNEKPGRELKNSLSFISVMSVCVCVRMIHDIIINFYLEVDFISEQAKYFL